ncbi:hypothetical protein [Burkholderia gladioli]|uniref:hypothetical protein n=1 Tax=Burkholderia gladioli TaxID=28095 RepID=UPI001640C1C6|nr:hypothetical protein [Burkholderia gladioli]
MKNHTLEEYTLPFDSISHFTAEEIYSLQMLGHIYNETNALCKLTYINRGETDAINAIKSASMFHAVLFVRLHAGKLHEAHITINSNPHIRDFLKKRCFANMREERGAKLLKAFNSAVGRCKWLSDARNQDAMHFGTYENLQKGVSTIIENKIDFEYIKGTMAMETLFVTSNTMTSLSFFHRSDNEDWKSGLSTLLNDLESIQDALYDLIHESIDSIVTQYTKKSIAYKKRLKHKKIKSFDRPSIHKYHMPYFFDFDNQATK